MVEAEQGQRPEGRKLLEVGERADPGPSQTGTGSGVGRPEGGRPGSGTQRSGSEAETPGFERPEMPEVLQSLAKTLKNKREKTQRL